MSEYLCPLYMCICAYIHGYVSACVRVVCRGSIETTTRDTEPTCDFCKYMKFTAEESFGRIIGKYTATGVNTTQNLILATDVPRANGASGPCVCVCVA